MATTRRRQSLAIIDQLYHEPWRFAFLQAVRILEAAVTSKHELNTDFVINPIAGLSIPQKEFLHFKNISTLGFSPANVSSVSIQALQNSDAKKQWQMNVQFFGLTGSHGVMPHYFTELLLQRLRDNDTALAAFLNISEHRSISLFFQASRKYQLPLQYENYRRHPKLGNDIFTHAISSLSGLGTSHLENRLSIPVEALLGYTGLYARPIRSAAALKSMLQHYFDLDTEIEQFCGQWQDLPDDIVTRLTGTDAGFGCNNSLGVNTLLGKSCWQVQSKFRIKLAPMNHEEFMELAPGGKKLEALQAFVSFFAGAELDYEILIQMNLDDIQPAQLTTDIGNEPLLGWNTPLGNARGANTSTLIDVHVSKHTTPSDAGLTTAA